MSNSDDINKMLEEFKQETFKTLPYRDTLEVLKRDLKRVEERKSMILQAIDDVSNLKYKKGDVVYHREYGNGIVIVPYVGTIQSLYNDWGNMGPNIPEGFTKDSSPGYVVHFVTKNIKDHNVSAVERFCQQDELVPYSDVTKVLFNNE